MEILSVISNRHDEMIDITGAVQSIISKQGIRSGICMIYTPHTTAAITINENADPSVVNDIITGLNHLNFEKIQFKHAEGNSPSHIKSSIIGCSELVCIEKGILQLGTWQGIYFCEFDGPRSRNVYIKIIHSE